MVSRPSDSASAFSGSVPEVYQRLMVPLIFEPYAHDLAGRLVLRAPEAVLEVGAGTGVVTRVLANRLEPSCAIVATDLNPAMLETAAGLGTARPVDWRPADAMQLPFADGSFDAVVCQFAAMFFPDRGAAFAEVRRVLRPGGVFLFNVWDRIEDNELAHVAEEVAASLFPQDPPRFLSTTPHGYFDEALIRADLTAGGFDGGVVSVDAVDHRSRAATSGEAAFAYCQGTPLRAELSKRDPGCIDHVTARVAEEIGRRFGASDVDAGIRALVVTATRS